MGWIHRVVVTALLLVFSYRNMIKQLTLAGCRNIADIKTISYITLISYYFRAKFVYTVYPYNVCSIRNEMYCIV